MIEGEGIGVRIWMLAVSMLVMTAVPAAAQTAGPSFDCSRAASAVERAICGDPALAEADRVMGKLFAAARVSAFGSGPSNMMPSQVVWLKEREACAAFDREIHKSREECLSRRYDGRNEELAAAALFAEPELALATLRRIDPTMAPLYEAVFLYASHAQGLNSRAPAISGQRGRLLDLLRPQYELLQSDDMRRYGRGILKDSVSGLDDALSSDDKFNATLAILAAYAEGTRIPMMMPCAALVRRPGLWGATLAVFGSSLDAGIPDSNCDTMLPPLPRLDALVARIYAGWPECQGTIRFMAYRSFNALVDAARLGSDLDAATRGGKGAPMPRLKGVAPSAVDAVVGELAAYYVRYRHAAPARARTAAGDAVRALLDAGHQCGGGEE